jgi:rare lipoprotein A
MSLGGPSSLSSDSAGRTYVQVGIFRDRSNAERLRHDLSSLGPIEVAPIQVGDGDRVFRVRVGPFSDDAAKRAQTQIATYGVTDSAIVTD